MAVAARFAGATMHTEDVFGKLNSAHVEINLYKDLIKLSAIAHRDAQAVRL